MNKYAGGQREVSVCADSGNFCERLPSPGPTARLRYNAGDGVGDVCARRDGQELWDENGDVNGVENGGDGNVKSSDNVQPLRAKQSALAQLPNSHCLSDLPGPRSNYSSSLWSRSS